MAAARIRNDSWKEDLNLREKLKDYVTEGLRRKQILDFMLEDFDWYAWSIRTLDRLLRYFDIRYMDTDVAVDEVKKPVMREMKGPGRLLGYRAMQRKLSTWRFSTRRDVQRRSSFIRGKDSLLQEKEKERPFHYTRNKSGPFTQQTR